MNRSAPFFLALRYLRPKRSFVSIITLISVLGVMLGVGVLVVVMSVFKGWQVEFKKLVLGFEPHLVLMQEPPSREPADPDQPRMARSNWRDVLALARAQPETASAQPIARGMVMAEHGKKAHGIEVLGLLPAEDNALLKKLTRHLENGAFDLDGDHIIMSDKVAAELGAKIGDTILLNAAESLNRLVREVRRNETEQDEQKRAAALDGVMPTGSEVTLVGILRSDTAGPRAYVPMNIGQELFSLEDGVSGIEIELHDSDRAEETADRLANSDSFPLDWTVSTWMTEHGFMLQNVENQQSLMWFLLLFIMLVAATCVMNTTITVTVQKRREIGMLSSMGARVRQIVGIFVLQGLIVASVGTLLGYIGGKLVLYFRNDIREFMADAFGIRIFDQAVYHLPSIPSHTVPADILIICSTSIVLCLIGALIPAYFAARVDPAVALRD